MASTFSPPPAEIDGVRIHAYAAIDEDVEWRGPTGGPFVLVGENADLLGPVPRLAIGLNYDGNDWLLLYCTTDWQSVAAVDNPSFDAAKMRAEQEYRGVSSKWINVT